MEPIGIALIGAAIVVGLVGIVVFVVPGLLIVWAAVLVWALVERTPLAWGVLALATVLALAGTVVKYLLPGQRMRDAGVPGRSIVLGALLGFVGFFLIPVVGLFIGFILGHLPGRADPAGRARRGLAIDRSRAQGGRLVDPDRAARRSAHRRLMGVGGRGELTPQSHDRGKNARPGGEVFQRSPK